MLVYQRVMDTQTHKISVVYLQRSNCATILNVLVPVTHEFCSGAEASLCRLSPEDFLVKLRAWSAERSGQVILTYRAERSIYRLVYKVVPHS